MKKLFFSALLLLSLQTFSENPSPPPVNRGNESYKHKHDDEGHGCGAPIDGGTWILISLAVGYGIYKIVKIRREHGPAH